jgi:hypothetical protein
VLRGLLVGALDRFDEHAPGFLGMPPASDPNPFVGLQVFVVGEEMLDLLENDRRKVLPLTDVRILRESRIHGHADQLLVATMLVFQEQDADGPGAHHASGDE